MCSMLVLVMTHAICLVWLTAQLDFHRFHLNRCVSNGSYEPHWTTFQPFSSQRIKNIVYTFGFFLWLDFGNSSGLDCASDLIFRLDSIGLQVLCTGIWLRALNMCEVIASQRNAWPNGVASRPKFSTCIYLRVSYGQGLKPQGSWCIFLLHLGFLRAGCWTNWLVVRMIASAWFYHLV